MGVSSWPSTAQISPFKALQIKNVAVTTQAEQSNSQVRLRMTGLGLTALDPSPRMLASILPTSSENLTANRYRLATSLVTPVGL